jgi:predicted phosphohydrolase
MKIQYCSDLHLEFRENKKYLERHPLIPEGDILLLAGDIIPFTLIHECNCFFNFLADNFACTYWIPGNHEYYHSDAADKNNIMKEEIRSNVFLVNNISVKHNDVRFIFSTLWSKISPAKEQVILRRLSDFRTIHFNGSRLSAIQYNQLHEQCIQFIRKELDQDNNSKSIMISHHIPTFFNYPEKYRGDIINEGFAVELSDLIQSSGINYWIYGHHHINIPAFTIGETQLLTNQLGYVRFKEHKWFNRAKTLVI